MCTSHACGFVGGGGHIRCAFGVWLQRVVRTTIGRWYRFERKAAGQGVSMDAPAQDGLEDQVLSRVLVEGWLDALPPRQRRAMQQTVLEGLTVDQAARAMRCTAGGLRATLFKARAGLRQRLPSDLGAKAPG